LDDDVVLAPRFLEAATISLQRLKGARVGGVMGKIVNIPPSSKFDVWFKRLFFLSDLGRGRVKLSGLPSIKVDDELKFVQSLAGGCTAYLKEVFERFTFDENLRGYGYLEDVDFSYRVGQKYRLLYQPLASLEHHPSTYRTLATRDLRKMFVQHHAYLFHKNFPQDLRHSLAYWLSVIGTLIYNGLWLKDLRACHGIIEGLLHPLRC
jgi:GT2 family glycosyltransferase